MPQQRLRDLKVRDFMSRDLVTGTADEPLSEILGRMRSNDVHEIPIVEKGKLVGVVSMAAVARHKSLQSGTKAQHVLQPAPEAPPDLSLPAASELFLSSGHRSLPIAEKGKLVGILSRSDVVRAMTRCPEIEGMTVGDVMTPQPQCVSANDTVAQARTIMVGIGERAIPVVDGERRLVGVVGLKDLTDVFARPRDAENRRGGAGGAKDPVRVLVGSIMHDPVAVPPNAPLPKALQLMADKRISTLVVEDRGEPAGVVTNADLVELAARFREREGLFVQISGLEEQPDVYDQMYEIIQKAMRRIGNLVTPRLLNVHVVAYKADGDRQKWSIRVRFSTDHEMYHVKYFDWDLFKALDGLLAQLEAQIKKEKDRKVTERRRGGS